MSAPITAAATVGEHLDALAENGYTVMRDAVAPTTVAWLLATVQRLYREKPPLVDADQPFLNRGHHVLYNLQRENIAFVRAFSTNHELVEILCGLLNDSYYRQIPPDRPNFILRAMAGRSSGNASMPLHIDSFIPSSGKRCFACQAAIILEDQSPETGCTLIVPGSHRTDEYADQAALAQAVPLAPNAGDIAIWDGRIWHGALGNTTDRSRWSIISTFTRWWLKQNFDITGTLPEPIFAQLTDDEKAMLGFCALPPRDETERLDIKTGHGDLKPSVAAYAYPTRATSGAPF